MIFKPSFLRSLFAQKNTQQFRHEFINTKVIVQSVARIVLSLIVDFIFLYINDYVIMHEAKASAVFNSEFLVTGERVDVKSW